VSLADNPSPVILSLVMLRGVLYITMLGVIILSAVMLSVVAPKYGPKISLKFS
jgi:hypothetical protein